MVKAGASRVPITPPLGTRLAGYPGRPAGAEFVYDDIFMRTLVMENDGGERSALLSVDLMAVDTAWVDELRRRVRTVLGISGENLLVAASHTHSATGGLLSFRDTVGKGVEAIFTDVEGGFDETLYEYLLRQAVSAIVLANARLQSCSLQLGHGQASGIASNRIHPEVQADSSCLVLSIVNNESVMLAVVFHYCCHPTTLGYQDTGISSDFPGSACRIIENAFDPGCVALFLNGTLGDISTRFSRQSQTYAEVERFGRILAGAVLQATASATPVDDLTLRARMATIDVAPKSARWLGQVEERAVRLRDELAHAEGRKSHGDVRQLKTALQGTENSRRLVAELSRIHSIPVTIQRLEIAPGLDLVAVPGEMFSSSAAELQNTVADRTVRIVGPANGYLGYIPPARVYEDGGYEVDSSFMEQGSAEAIVDCAAHLLQ